MKTNFYSADEYLLYHKSLLKRELKALIRKNADTTIKSHRSHQDAQYTLFFRQRVKKFFVLTFRRVGGVVEESKVDRKGGLPQIREHDLVLAFPNDSTSLEHEHALCVVDSLQDEGNQVILKIVLRESRQTIDERNWNLRNLLAEGSSWTLLKVCNLENFNRSYLGYDQF